MATLCLKCGYQRQPSDTAPDEECPQCGRIYAKVAAALKAKKEAALPFDFKNASKAERQKQCNRIAKEIGDDQFFTKKELHYLPELLLDGEQVLAFTSGLMEGNTWLIALTDRRIIFLDKGMMYGLKQAIIDLDKVSTIAGVVGLVLGEIQITESARTLQIKMVPRQAVKTFTAKTLQAMEDRKNKQVQPQIIQAPQPAANPYDQLEKIAALKEKGILSLEEFEREKKKILSA